MKNALLPLAVAAAGLFALPAIGHAQSHDGAFINGNVGRASLDEGPLDDDDTGYGVNAGYRWAVSPSVLIGVEGGYVDLGKYSGSTSATLAPPVGTAPPDPTIVNGRATGEIHGWTVGANGHFNISPNWYVSGRAGFFRADLESRVRFDAPDDVNRNYGYDDNADGWYAGAGVGYDFSNNVSVGINYDHYRADKHGFELSPDLVSVSGEYRF